MTGRYKAIKISIEGFLTDVRDEPIICPVRGTNCNLKCAWLSAEDGIIRCQDTVIGALHEKPMHLSCLYARPEVYDVDESLRNYDLNS